MRKWMSVLLLLAVLAATVFAVFPAAASDTDGMTNVALGCTYTGDAPYTQDADKIPGYREIDGKELTDGVKGSSAYGTEWYALYRQKSYTITLDLGKQVKDLAVFQAEFGKEESASISLPTSVRFAVSKDNQSFTDLGEAKNRTGAGDSYHTFRLDASTDTAYRYVRMTVASGSGMFVFVSEVEVFAGYVSSISMVSGNGFFEGKTLRGLSEKTSVETFLDMVNTRTGVSITNAAGQAKNSGYIATGDQVHKRDAQGRDTAYTVVIDGDLNQDGVVNNRDYIAVKRAILQGGQLSDAVRSAADVNGDGRLAAADYIAIKRHVLKIGNLYKKYEPEVPKDGRGDVTEEFKQMNTKDTIPTYTSHDMTVTRVSDGLYTVTCQVYDGTLSLNLARNGWGTFNLGRWELKDRAGTHTFITGGTDWEYVYRVAPSASSGVVWSGGNHANEKLRSLTLKDGATGKTFELAVGQRKTLNNLVIVEETNLYWDPAGDDKKYQYDENNIYCEATRTYTIVGPQIRLAVDYRYLKDAYYQYSYTCMFPIQKQYGLYCAFLDDEKLLSVIETYKVGKADYSGKMHQGYAADRCIMWGYDGREAYKFDVRVLTPETSTNGFNNTTKTMFWDMNTGTNKLYFSKFPSTGAKERVAAGSQIHTECQWTFYKD